MNIDMRIAFRRTRHGIGDLAIALRAIELIRLKYPCSILMVQSGYPSLLKDHPAINYSYNLSESLPDYDILIDFDISPDNTIPKHALFCNKASETLLQNGYDGIVWDSRPQTLWVHPKERARVWSMIKNISETPIPRARVENLEMGSRVPVGIFWRSAYKHRTWGRFPELIRMLASNPQIQVFCFDSEIPIKLENVYNVIGRELNEVLAWVSNMSYVITNDSAGLHLAGEIGRAHV